MALFALWQGITRVAIQHEISVGVLGNSFYGWLLIVAALLLLFTSLSARLCSTYLRNFAATILSSLYIMLGIDAWRSNMPFSSAMSPVPIVPFRDGTWWDGTMALILACGLLFYDALWKAECLDV